MNIRLLITLLVFVASLTLRADLKPTDSDQPLFRFFVPGETKIEQIIPTVKSATACEILREDTHNSQITFVLKSEDAQALAEFMQKYDRVQCAIVGLTSNKIPGLEDKPPVGVAVGARLVVREDGLIEFSQLKLPADLNATITKYLRHRFGL
jgi:hypothetical protein